MNATATWHDPVVAELHATREHLTNQYHNDLLAYSKAAEARCRASGLMMLKDPKESKGADAESPGLASINF